MHKRASVVLLMMIAVFLTLTLAPFAAATDTGLAVGTWKKDSAAGVESAQIVAQTNSFRLVVNTVDPNGNPIHAEFTGKYDGKDYPVTGLPNADTVSLVKIDAQTFDCLYKKGGKAVRTERIVLSKDGKRATVFKKGTDQTGLDATVVSVWDKQ
jgi:hypothetical protein